MSRPDRIAPFVDGESSSAWGRDVARVTTTEFTTGTAARAAERAAIRAGRPLYNVTCNPEWEAAQERRRSRETKRAAERRENADLSCAGSASRDACGGTVTATPKDAA